MNLELAIVVGCVALATFVLIRRVLAVVRGGSGGCGSCASNGPSPCATNERPLVSLDEAAPRERV